MKFSAPIELLQKYLAGKATEDEIQQVEKWYASFKETENTFPEENLQETREKIFRRIVRELKRPVSGEADYKIPLYKRLYVRWSAAAILIFLVAGFFLLLFRSPERNVAEIKTEKFGHDVAPPVNNKATLTLADGTRIELDSSANGTLAIQGKINVVKKNDGQIAYNGVSGNTVSYNTLSVPNGSKPMRLLLVDGTEVWLNVASSITYPTAFTGSERKVEITGEAYFEVTKNKEMPFVVKKRNYDAEIKVLGTQFNVNAYDDEQTIKITLLEGAVDVSKAGKHSLLKPGEQAQLAMQSIKVVDDANLEEVMAWKNGRFYFDGADIKTVMRQVEKWYNVDVNFDAEIPYSFVAKISRNVNASALFRILELTDLVHFKIDGNKITVIK